MRRSAETVWTGSVSHRAMNLVHLYKYTFFYDWSCKLELFSYLCSPTETVRLVQLVEHQIVVLGVVGSSPTSHPKRSALVGRTFRLRCGAPGAGASGRAPGSTIHTKRPRPLSPCTPRGRGKGFPRTAAPSPFRRRLAPPMFPKRTISQVFVRFKNNGVLEAYDYLVFRTLQRRYCFRRNRRFCYYRNNR